MPPAPVVAVVVVVVLLRVKLELSVYGVCISRHHFNACALITYDF